MKISQHSPFALQQMKNATGYMNSQIDRYGRGLKVDLNNQGGKPTIEVKNADNQVVKRIDGAQVANKMSNGLYVVV